MIPRFCRACSESTSLFVADLDTEASWRGPLEPARGPGARMRADGGADVEAPVDVTRQLAGSGPEAPTPRARGCGCKPYECRRKPCLPPPLPCWWSRVVRGWASCCGHDVLPLSLDDPGGVVTRGSRALVTADKGNGPLCVRSFVTWVRDRSSTGWPRTHAARGGRRDGYRGHRGLHRH